MSRDLRERLGLALIVVAVVLFFLWRYHVTAIPS